MQLPDKQKYTSDEFFRIIPESNSERYEKNSVKLEINIAELIK